VADFAKGLERDPENADLWLKRSAFYVRQQKWDLAIADLAQAAQLRPGTVVARAHRELAQTLQKAGRTNQAGVLYKKLEAMCREDVAAAKKRCGDTDRRTDAALCTLAGVLSEQDKLADAEAVWREELETEKRLSGNEHPFVANSLMSLGDVLRNAGKLVEAEATLREALAIRTKFLGKDDAATASTANALGGVLQEQGKFADAEAIFRERLERLRSQASSDDGSSAAALAQMTSLLLAQKKYVEAEPLARECLAIREKKMPDSWLTFNAQSTLGGSLLGQAKYAEAEPLLLSGYEGMKQREAEIRSDMRATRLKEAIERLVQLYEETKQPEKAAQWREKLAESDSGRGEERPAEAQEKSPTSAAEDRKVP
jgi:tetratricopeptide (TPR) repeat protein